MIDDSKDNKDNHSSHSIDVIRRKPNKKLEIIIEENNSFHNDLNNPELSESKTQSNFKPINSPLDREVPGKRSNSSEKRRRSENIHKKVQQILNYRDTLNMMDPESEYEDKYLGKEEENSKKKIPEKVNKNLKLLNLIKERMNKEELNENIRDDNEDENNKINKNNIEDNSIKKENQDNNNDIKNGGKSDMLNEPYKNRFENKYEEKQIDFKNINGNENKENDDAIKKKEEERKQKLLKLFEKKFNKKQNEEQNEDNKETEKEENEKENDNKENNIKNIITYPHSNLSSVSNPSFSKRNVGDFHINTPKSKHKNIKREDSEKENENDNKKEEIFRNYKKKEKFTEIPKNQRNKLVINISPKNSHSLFDDKVNDNENDTNKIDSSDIKKDNNINNNYNDESNKKDNKDNSNNNSNNNSTKKGALEILELLKVKKKEQNENILRARSQGRPMYNDKEENDDEKIIDNQKLKDIDSSYIFNQKKTDDEKQKKRRNSSDGKYSSLPKKTFRDEEDEDESNFQDKLNKTQQHFRNNRLQNHHQNKMNDNNNNRTRKRHYINNINNINNNINNFFNLDNQPNYQERRTVNYINNANNLRNKYNKRLLDYYSLNQTSKNSPKRYEQNKSMIKPNLKSLDTSFDEFRSRKDPNLRKYNYKPNYNSINTNINSTYNLYGPQKLPRNNNSPRLYNPSEKNIFDNPIKNERIGRVYNRVNRNMAYIKKSPGRIKDLNNSNYNYNKNNNSNNIIRNIYNMKNKGNLRNNNINDSNNNMGRIDVSSIQGLNSSSDTYSTNRLDYINTNYNNYYNNKNNINKVNNQKENENSMLFNLEDLMVLEERLNDISIALEANRNIEKKCFNFWNYYYNCSLYKILEKIFKNEDDSNVIRLSINYELMSIMVCYEFSFLIDMYDEDLSLSLLELIIYNHDNLMIICEYILTKIAPENKDNIWVLKLQEIVKNSKLPEKKEIKNNSYLTPINKISNNIKKIIQQLRNILSNYETDLSYLLKKYLSKIDSKSYEDINDFFRINILRENNFEGSIVASSFLKQNKFFKPFPAPYIKEPTSKPYTLILDLDETLVNFKIKSSKEGTLRARPFLFGFLEEMGHYYELIVWTSGTEAYANSLIDAIESEKQYFDYVFFREHAIIIGDDFVKDLNRIGRSLDRVIIVDDMPQNFRLQRRNGITIKPFLGDDYKDSALYDLLPILKHIAEDGGDVRIGLEKYRDEIVKKITSNISKHNI